MRTALNIDDALLRKAQLLSGIGQKTAVLQAGLEYRRFWVETFSGVEGDVNHLGGVLFYFF